MVILFGLICIALLIMSVVTKIKKGWGLSLIPLAISPLVVYTTGLIPQDLTWWSVGNIVLLTIPLILYKNKKIESDSKAGILLTICITNAIFILMVVLSLMGIDIVNIMNTTTLLSWSAILILLFKDNYEHNTLFNISGWYLNCFKFRVGYNDKT